VLKQSEKKHRRKEKHRSSDRERERGRRDKEREERKRKPESTDDWEGRGGGKRVRRTHSHDQEGSEGGVRGGSAGRGASPASVGQGAVELDGSVVGSPAHDAQPTHNSHSAPTKRGRDGSFDVEEGEV
jgi:hypothetical protein